MPAELIVDGWVVVVGMVQMLVEVACTRTEAIKRMPVNPKRRYINGEVNNSECLVGWEQHRM